MQITGQPTNPTSVDDDDVENDPDDELEQSSKDLKTASKRANIADLLKVCHVYVCCSLPLFLTICLTKDFPR